MSLQDLNLDSQYSSSSANLISDFLAPAISVCKQYDRAAGYFNSSLFALAPAAWSDFFLKDGNMRLLTSVQLSPSDAIVATESPNEPIDLRGAFLDTWASLTKTDEGWKTARLLRALVGSGRLELRVAAFRKPRGLFHDKLGILTSTDDSSVSFTGSANETLSAWSGLANHESFDVFRSWIASDADRVLAHKKRFSDYWNGQSDGLQVFSGEELKDVIVGTGPEEQLEDVLTDIRSELELAIPSLSKRHHRPRKIVFRPYQIEAVENWELSGRRGIISFATGGGKTIAALEIIRRWSESGNPTLILVPSEILVTQWLKEIAGFFAEARVLRADSRSPVSWRPNLAAFLGSRREGPPRIVVTTYTTTSLPAFARAIPSPTQFLLVGDEVHRFGAENTRRIRHQINPSATLGLSATPVRNRDDEGSDSIFDFFGPALEPEYSLNRAISEGNLVPYKFSFTTARLSSEEQRDWNNLSAKIARLVGSDSKPNELSPAAQKLLIDRARIAKVASAKVALAAEILNSNFNAGDRWLVYCETQAHLESVKQEVKRVLPRIPVMTYTSINEVEHAQVLHSFEASGGILLAIRCLDEGVDIPLINKALIISSSQSRREFIQRRGRILRHHPTKHKAELFDFLMQTSDGEILMPAELERLIDFAGDAINQEPHITLKALRGAQVARGEGVLFD
jgi:superfamily II DNA or RNA helicase